MDLFPFFSSSCYKGFGDGEKGFYAVYRGLFATLCEEDNGFSDEVRKVYIYLFVLTLILCVNSQVLRYPPFGDSGSQDDVWQEFYSFFSGYVTPRSYSWLDK